MEKYTSRTHDTRARTYTRPHASNISTQLATLIVSASAIEHSVNRGLGAGVFGVENYK